jgi:membrane fusion protein (multidrug efflux system)
MKFSRWIITLSVCVLITLVLAGVKYYQINRAIAYANSFPEASETVEAMRVESRPWQTTLHTLGEVVAPQRIELRNEVSGIIRTLGFAPGDTVAAGQILVVLDSAEEQSTLEAAEAEARLAELALNRYRKLITQKAVSKDQLDEAQARYDIALARVRTLQVAIGKKTLSAPFAARAGLHTLAEGQYLQADSTITTLVGTGGDVWVDFNLSQFQSHLEMGSQVKVLTPRSDGEPLKGIVIARNPAIDPDSRNVQFRALFRGASEKLPVGSRVDVDVALTLNERAFVIPVNAVRYDSLGTYVYELVVNDTKSERPSYRALRRSVQIGSEKAGYVIVNSGLEGGELIAANGAFKLRPGKLVYVSERRNTSHE